MSLSKDELVLLARWLDTALALPETARAAWLEQLKPPSDGLKQHLRAMLAKSGDDATSANFDTLPIFSSTGLDGPLVSENFSTASDRRVVGPYRLLHPIGRGGMSTVYLASRIDETIKRSVALKLPHVHLDGRQFRARYIRERDILAQLTHPHIARLYDAGMSSEGQPYLAMEFIDGRPLTEFCDAHRYTTRARIALFLQVLAAVQYAHAHLVIHRDLKPSNILTDESAQVHLLDFGIAKLLRSDASHGSEASQDPAITEFGGRAMTPDYAAPEQIAGEALSTASDVYSLGVVLYELLAGARPYRLKRQSRRALEDAILSAGAVRPSLTEADATVALNRGTTLDKLRGELRGELDAIVMQALKRDPSERYATADAFGRDLKDYLAGRPVRAKKDTLVYRSAKFLRRNRLAVAGAATVIAALSVGFGVALWQARVAQREAATARQQTSIARSEAHTAESVLAFMENIFKANSANQPDPLKARQTTARELLDVGAAQIESALDDAPIAKLDVLRTLGNMYDEMGLSEKGLQLQRKRVNLGRQVLRNDDPVLAKVYADFANAAERLDMHAEAEPAFVEAESILDRAHDTTSTTWAQVEMSLAFFYEGTDPKKAGTYAERGVRAWRHFGDSGLLVNALAEQAYNDIDFGDYRGAEKAAHEALDVAGRIGAQANDQIASLNEALGYAESGLDDMAAAEASFRQALAIAAASGGDVLMSRLETAGPLGDFLTETGRVAEGLRVLNDAHTMALSLDGVRRSTSWPIRITMRYGRALMADGRLEDGFDLVRSAAATLATRADDPLPALESQVLDARAQALIEMGEYPEAEAVLVRAAGLHRRSGEEDTPFGNRNVAEHARVLMLLDRMDEADRLIDHYWVGTQLPAAARPALERGLLLAESSLARHANAAALAAAAQVRALTMGSPNRPYLKSWEWRADLLQGEALRAAGRAGEALPLLEQAVDLAADQQDRRVSVSVAQAQVALAECLVDLGQRPRAQTLLAAAQAVDARHPQLGAQFLAPLHRLELRLASSPPAAPRPRTPDDPP